MQQLGKFIRWQISETDRESLEERQHEPLRDAGFCYLAYPAFFSLHGNTVAHQCERWGVSTLRTGVNVPCSTFGLCCAKSLSSLGSLELSHCMQLYPAHFSVWKITNERSLLGCLFLLVCFFSITSGEFAATIFALPPHQ